MRNRWLGSGSDSGSSLWSGGDCMSGSMSGGSGRTRIVWSRVERSWGGVWLDSGSGVSGCIGHGTREVGGGVERSGRGMGFGSSGCGCGSCLSVRLWCSCCSGGCGFGGCIGTELEDNTTGFVVTAG